MQNNNPNDQRSTGSLSIAADQFEHILATAYPDPAHQDTLRFWFFAAKERGWSLATLARHAGPSTTVLSRLFNGTYKDHADPATAIASLEKTRANFHEAAANPEFIETSLWHRLTSIFDKTRALANVSILWGPMGIGKTYCIDEYRARNNHGRTQVVRFPAGASFAYFVTHVARSCGVATRSQSAYHQREKIISVLSAGQRLLIIDELHQAFLTTRTDTAVKCCEFLREIADVAKCGLTLVGTEELKKEIFTGPHKEALRQLVDRGTIQVPLHAKATKQDYKKFLQAYRLDFPSPEHNPHAHQLLTDIIASTGLRQLTLHLRDGQALASKLGKPYTWDHFETAFNAIASYGK
ncbi:MAG: AAA family ATPase [Luteolibacter sp.]